MHIRNFVAFPVGAVKYIKIEFANCKIKVKAVEAAECTSGKVLIISNYANEGVTCDVAWRNPQARSAAVDVDCALVLRRHHL